MEKKTLWFFLLILLAVDIWMLVQRSRLNESLRALRSSAASATLQAAYTDEEEALVVSVSTLPPTFPALQAEEVDGESVQFLLIASVNDCTNCIEDEIEKLNHITLRAPPQTVTGIQAVFVDEDKADAAQAVINHLSPAPLFPVSIMEVLSQIPDATTPLVLVVRARDKKILDAHKPIPEDLTRRDAFYTRWEATLGLS